MVAFSLGMMLNRLVKMEEEEAGKVLPEKLEDKTTIFIIFVFFSKFMK